MVTPSSQQPQDPSKFTGQSDSTKSRPFLTRPSKHKELQKQQDDLKSKFETLAKSIKAAENASEEKQVASGTIKASKNPPDSKMTITPQVADMAPQSASATPVGTPPSPALVPETPKSRSRASTASTPPQTPASADSTSTGTTSTASTPPRSRASTPTPASEPRVTIKEFYKEELEAFKKLSIHEEIEQLEDIAVDKLMFKKQITDKSNDKERFYTLSNIYGNTNALYAFPSFSTAKESDIFMALFREKLQIIKDKIQ